TNSHRGRQAARRRPRAPVRASLAAGTFPAMALARVRSRSVRESKTKAPPSILILVRDQAIEQAHAIACRPCRRERIFIRARLPGRACNIQVRPRRAVFDEALDELRRDN